MTEDQEKAMKQLHKIVLMLMGIGAVAVFYYMIMFKS